MISYTAATNHTRTTERPTKININAQVSTLNFEDFRVFAPDLHTEKKNYGTPLQTTTYFENLSFT